MIIDRRQLRGLIQEEKNRARANNLMRVARHADGLLKEQTEKQKEKKEFKFGKRTEFESPWMDIMAASNKKDASGNMPLKHLQKGLKAYERGGPSMLKGGIAKLIPHGDRDMVEKVFQALGTYIDWDLAHDDLLKALQANIDLQTKYKPGAEEERKEFDPDDKGPGWDEGDEGDEGDEDWDWDEG